MKKLFGTLGLLLILAILFASCANGNKDEDDSKKTSNSGSSSSSSSSSNSSSSNPTHITISESDITTDTNTITLSDGKWKFIHTDTFISPSKDSGTCTVSVSEQKITFIEVVEENDGLIVKASSEHLSIMNNTDYYGLFVTRLNNNPGNWTIKTNNNNSKYKAVSSSETIILEKSDL